MPLQTIVLEALKNILMMSLETDFVIEYARSLTDLPIFVSSVVPEELAEAVRMGADAIELGNFDIMYRCIPKKKIGMHL